MSKAFDDYIAKGVFPTFHNAEALKDLSDKINNTQVLLIFTNEDLGRVTEITSKFISNNF